MGVAITSVITTIYNVFNRFPAIPKVPFRLLGTVVKNCQLMLEIPFTKDTQEKVKETRSRSEGKSCGTAGEKKNRAGAAVQGEA